MGDTAHIMKDGHAAYRKVNFAESCFSLLKRSIIETHHHMSQEHRPKYLREHEFRRNMRRATDGERTIAAFKGAANKRLMYREPVTR